MTDILEIGGANSGLGPITRLPRHTELPQATRRAKTTHESPAANPIRQARTHAKTRRGLPAGTPLGGQTKSETHGKIAAQFNSDEVQKNGVAQKTTALVGNITMELRRYVDLRRSRARLDLQAKAMARYSCNGDKVEGAKLHAKAMEDAMHPLRVWLQPYLDAMAPLDSVIKAQEKVLIKLSKQLPVAKWAEGIPGLSPRYLAMIVGECGIGPGQFRNPSCLWKRMGMAVINGGRQRKVTGDAAIEHGFVARRLALMWNIGNHVALRKGILNPKDADGNKTGAVALNLWGQLYLDRKAHELTKSEGAPGKPMTPIWAHNRAKRYVEKRLLRELWKAWRAEV